MRVALGSLVVALAACGGGSPEAMDPSDLTCAQIQSGLGERLAAVSRQCTTAADCGAVGYASRDGIYATCDCAPYFGTSCTGTGVNAAAWQADDRVQALLVEWTSRCATPEVCADGTLCGCDCGRGELSCRDGACVVGDYNCFPPFPADAAID